MMKTQMKIYEFSSLGVVGGPPETSKRMCYEA